MRYFYLYEEYQDLIAELDDAEAGRLLKAMLAYCYDGTEIELTGNERIVWRMCRRLIDRSFEVQEKRRKAGRARHGLQPEAEE